MSVLVNEPTGEEEKREEYEGIEVREGEPDTRDDDEEDDDKKGDEDSEVVPVLKAELDLDGVFELLPPANNP